jgi:signal transduction histidine kinase
LSPEWVDLTVIARDQLTRLAGEDEGHPIAASVQSGLRGYIDPQLARTLFGNLIGNSWKFTGGAREPRIEIGATNVGVEEAFYVRDNGAGFNEAHADRLFSPFQRLHSIGEFLGTGIGLATAQRIVQRHGGRIWAEGKVGSGATFYFTLPGRLPTGPT